MFKSKAGAFFLFVIAFFAVWNLLEFIYTKFIQHGVFTFTFLPDAVLPVAVAAVLGYILILKKK